uniref:piggyBat transposase n=1 Tax=Myotis lucifugus TaxID=59463 RepID=A0ABF7PQ92_MYOLU
GGGGSGMAQHSDYSDDEFCADKLSNYSCDSDLENASTSDEDSSDDEVMVRPRTLRRRRISSSSSDSESDIEGGREEWSHVDNPPVLEDFLGHQGLNTDAVINNIEDAVKLFIGDDFFEFLVEESNRYYNQNRNNFKLSKKSLKWKDITPQEMKKFLGLIVLMGQVRKDRRDDYWTTEPWTETPYFGKTMTRDRFRQIWKAWHFNNNADIVNESDRLCKVRPVLDYFVPKFINIYKPHQQLSLDEGIVPWRGRLFFRVYNAGKIVKYGILVRLLCESDTGYICNMEIYCGEGKRLLETIQTVVSPYTDSWYHIYMDNYYNSVANCEALMKNKFRICGTIRKNRGIPKDFQTISLKKGETKFIRKNDILLQVWQSKKPVYLISSIHSAEMEESQNIDRTSKKKIVKPNALIDYNKHMKGVDRADQYLSYYSILRRTVKWTKRLAMYMINCALFNSYAVYKSVRQRKMGFKMFLKQTAIHWLTDDIPEDMDIVPDLQPVPSTSGMRAKPPTSDPPCRLSMDMRKHTLQAIVGSGKKKNILRRCRVCSVHKLRSETRYMCKFCNIPLHKGACFEKYHTLKNY